MKKLLLTFCCLLVSVLCFAQTPGGSDNNGSVTLGIMGGADLAYLKVKLSSGSPAYNNLVEPFSFGINADIKLNDDFSVRPGIFYAAKGGDFQYTETFINPGSGSFSENTEQVFNLKYLEVPVTFISHLAVADDFNLLIGAGPYVSFGLNGKLRSAYSDADGQTQKLTFGKNGQLKQIDPGATGLFGIETVTGFTIAVNYDVGFINIIQNNSTGDEVQSLKTGALYLSVGYSF